MRPLKSKETQGQTAGSRLLLALLCVLIIVRLCVPRGRVEQIAGPEYDPDEYWETETPAGVVSAEAMLRGNAQSYRQLNETLEGLGITGLAEEELDELELYWQSMEEYGWADSTSKMVILLDAIGSGYYILAGEGPGQVYSFDMEVWDVGGAYGRVLTALGGISGGELAFADITETEVEAATGAAPREGAEYGWDELVWRVGYTLNGQPQEYLAEYGGDWFDIEIFSQISSQLAGEGSENRVWLTSDGYQEIILLYGSTGWAQRFMRQTGVQLWLA